MLVTLNLKRLVLILKSKNLFICFYICIFLSIVFILSLNFPSNKNLSNSQVVRLNEVTRSVFYAPQYVAIELGYFKDNNLEVKLSSAEGSDRTMTAILSNQADIGLLGTSSVISVYSQGKEDYPILFAQLTHRDGSFLAGRDSDFEWDNLKGKEIIAGRKGGVPEMVLEYILKNKGFDIQNDLTLLNNIKFDLMGIAFSRGVGDYVCLFEPTASMLKNEKSFHILKSLGVECDEISYTGYCASKKYIQDNPKVIQSFVDAIYKAQIWINNHSSEEIAKVILPYFVDSSLELLTECVENYISSQVWCSEPIIKKSGFDLLQKIMIEAKELDKEVKFENLVENSFSFNAVNKINAS